MTALRLTTELGMSLWHLHRTGSDGMSVELADHPMLFESYGLAERFTDDARVFRDRLRCTELGHRVALTLIAPQRSAR